jgi:hypothetical protein
MHMCPTGSCSLQLHDDAQRWVSKWLCKDLAAALRQGLLVVAGQITCKEDVPRTAVYEAHCELAALEIVR